MPSYLSNLYSIIIFFVIGVAVVFGAYFAVWILAPSSKNREKIEPYECGEIITGQPWVHVNMRYYIFAMLFLIFDIETVFLFPWAVIFRELGMFGLIEMLIFIIILGIGLAYPWKKGVLVWDSSMKK